MSDNKKKQREIEVLAALHDGNQNYEEGNFEAATKLYKKVLGLDPKNFKAGMSLAACFLGSGNSIRAKKVIQGLEKAYPKDAQIKNNLGCLLYSEQAFEKAEKYFRQATELDPSDMDYWSNVGICKMARKKEKDEGRGQELLNHALFASNLADPKSAAMSALKLLKKTGGADGAGGNTKKSAQETGKSGSEEALYILAYNCEKIGIAENLTVSVFIAYCYAFYEKNNKPDPEIEQYLQEQYGINSIDYQNPPRKNDIALMLAEVENAIKK